MLKTPIVPTSAIDPGGMLDSPKPASSIVPPKRAGPKRKPIYKSPPSDNGGPGNGNGGACCLQCAQGKRCEKENGMHGTDIHEYWDCQGGLVAVKVDGKGCPVEDKYCKIQVGPAAGPTTLATGVAGVITIAITNFTWAKIRGLVLSVFDGAAGNADLLHTLGVTQIRVQGVDNIDGEVTGERYRADATGAGVGTAQAYRGTIGSAGGTVTIDVINRSAVTVIIGAALDVNAVR